MNSLTEQYQRIAKRAPLEKIRDTDLDRKWDIRMVYESNAFKGNSLNLHETELTLGNIDSTKHKPLRERTEAVNLAEAWQQVKKTAQPGAIFTESILLDLHRILHAKVDDNAAGIYRTTAVRIAGSKLTPPNPIKVPDLIDALFAEFESISDPIEKAAKLHHGIASIHPFADGNRRIARLAMNFILLATSFPPISFPLSVRPSYLKALETADEGNINYLLQLIHAEIDKESSVFLHSLEHSRPASRTNH